MYGLIEHTTGMSKEEASSVAKELKRLRESAEPKPTIREMADALGIPHTSYAYYEDGFKKQFLPVEIAFKIADVLSGRGIKRSEVMALAGVVENPRALKEDAHRSRAAVSHGFAEEIPAPFEMGRDMPVLGHGSCGDDGLFEWNGETIDMVRRPPRLRGIADAYALYVAGESMSPWREEHELVYVHPKAPVRVGDYVVVQLKATGADETPSAYIKKLVKKTGTSITLLQYNPRKEKVIPLKAIKDIHKIVDWSELMGI